MKISEVAEYMCLSERTIYKLVRRGVLPAVRIGGVYRVDKHDLDDWMRSKKSRSQRAKAGKIINDSVTWEAIREEKDGLKKRLLFIGLLTGKLASKSVRPVILGGTAVEFYTAGGYATADIDIACPSHLIDEVEDELKLKRDGRYWYNEEIGIVLEAPTSFVDATAAEHLVEVRVDNLKLYLLGVEDLIIDRLNAFVHWQSTDDGNWARELIAIQADEIDWSYLKRVASKNELTKALVKLVDELGLREKLLNENH